MSTIKTIIIFFFTGFVVIVYFIPGIPFFILWILGLKRFASYGLYYLGLIWGRFIIALIGCPMTVTGRENIPKEGGLCFVSNHTGIFDIMLALAYTGRPFGFIAKKELLFLPGINLWIWFLGGLFIDRKKPRNALKTINKGIKRIKKGGAMLIFPEGTRTRGKGIAPFHPGSLKLATQSEADIVPMAITGSYDIFEKTRTICPVPVFVSFLPVVKTSELPPEDRKQILADKLHDLIAEVLETHKASVVQ
jgi:1-acyl-sn-glycerol-3-phosphate acyltransferase